MKKGKTISRRELILRAARETFKEKGFHAAATAEIARRAGVAEGTIFKHFGTKKELLFALLEPFKAFEMGEFLCGAASEQDEEKLRRYLENHLSFVQENFTLFKILLYESQFYPELREQFIEKVVLKMIGPVEKCLQDGMAEGKYRQTDPAVAARALFGMLAAFIAWKEILQADAYREFDEKKVIQEVITIFLQGIEK